MIRLPLRCSLELPEDPACLHLARSFVREVASLAGLPEADTEGLVLATDEACTNVLEHAFEPGEEGGYTVRAEVDAASVTICIVDRGIPFEAPPVPEPLSPQRRGLGFHLIRGSVDRLEWIRHGKEGKELRLVKNHPGLMVADRLPAADLTPYPPSAPPAAGCTYEIRRLRPEDALAVARALYRTYGYTYPTEDLYFPDRVARMNESGQLLSVVALTGGGEVVGHYALEFSEARRVAECGQAVVIPAHRGVGLLNRMREALEGEARTLGLVGLFGQPVTSHILSQQMNESFGARVCGLALGLVPRTFSFKAIRSQLPQRETCMLYFKALHLPSPTRAFPPDRHREILSRTYAHLGLETRFACPDRAAGESRASVRFDPSWGYGAIQVRRIGDATAGELRRARKDLCEHGRAEVVYLDLPLSQPGCAEICEVAEGEGFFFGGVGPFFLEDGDALRLQYLNCELDASQVQVFSPFGRELLDYAEAERKRVGG